MELEILKAIQTIANPFFDILFQLITMIGEQTVIIVIMASIYWAYDKKLGEFVAYSSLTSVLVNGTIKDCFNRKRPIGEPGIRSLRVETATGYSFPSGHTQQATSFYGSIAKYTKKKWVYSVAITIVLLVGLSRMYLGVHWPTDVLFGIIFGVLSIVITSFLFNKVKNRELLYFITFIVFLPVLFFAQSPDFVKGLGTFLGFSIGIFIEHKYVNFSIEGTTFNKICRVLVGILILLLLKVGLKLIFPEMLVFDFIRYMLLTLIGIGVYPAILKKLKL